MASSDIEKTLRLRIKLSPEIILGPGKAQVLRGIRDTGSISATGRLTGMSYKRTWDLVNRMNHDYRQPLIQTNTGGQHGGGASLTATGAKVLALYERIMENTAQATAKELAQLNRLANLEAAGTARKKQKQEA
ncbi:MAG TPA: ModE family transcriptional regulator [Hyphomicrobiales bacterium]|nr:ModE family transcriptional regulator [Hyphomicrobiales bacterium]